MIFFTYVDHYEKYALMASLLMDSLVRNSGVGHKQIYVAVDKALSESKYVKSLNIYNVISTDDLVYRSRMGRLEAMFELTNTDKLVYLDSDMLVQPGTDLVGLADKQSDCDIAYHEIPGWSFKDAYAGKRPKMPFLRAYLACLKHYKIQEQDFISSYANRNWNWGSFMVLNSRVRETKFWEVVRVSNELGMACDETAQWIGHYVDPRPFALIHDPRQLMTNTLSAEALSRRNCILHFAGSHKDKVLEDLKKLYHQKPSFL